MNREDVRSVFQFVKIQAEKTHGWEGVEIKMEICGSYRRGGEACTDVDILITMPKEDGRERGFLAALLKRLHHKRTYSPFVPTRDFDRARVCNGSSLMTRFV